jgi:WD40 repeat protein
VLATLNEHQGHVLTASFSADGTRVVTGSNDGTTKVWNAQSGQLLSTISGNRVPILQAFFADNDSQVVTLGQDYVINVWNVALETRSADQVQQFVERTVPYQLRDGVLRLREK